MEQTVVKLTKLPNEVWYTYLTYILKLINKYPAMKTLLAVLLAPLEKVYAEAGNSLEVVRTSQLSRDVDDADLQRDRTIGGLNNYVRAYLFSTDADKRLAAERLMVVIDHYSTMAQAPQDKESSMIINFIEELESNYTADMETIGLEEHKEQLKSANERFIDLLDRRTAEAATRTHSRMIDVRREGNRLIRLLYAQTEILQLAETQDASIAQFAGELNAESLRINANLKRAGEKA